jgi:hypothetical protein
VIVALQQLKLGTTEIAVDQVLTDSVSIGNCDGVTPIAYKHFRGRTSRRFAEFLGGGNSVHFDDSELHPVPL